jgi:hypothetical protein
MSIFDPWLSSNVQLSLSHDDASNKVGNDYDDKQVIVREQLIYSGSVNRTLVFNWPHNPYDLRTLSFHQLFTI